MNKEIKILTLNVRGIVDSRKRNTIFAWLREQNADVCFLQEVHCTNVNVKNMKRDWNGNSNFCLSNSPHSKGVAILFKENLTISVKGNTSINDGRTLMVNCEINKKVYNFVNIYSPNREGERIKYLDQVYEWLQSNTDNTANIILGGDFNCCLNDNDREPKTHLKDKSRLHFKNLINNLELTDAWYSNNVKRNGQRYTWNDSKTASRLDYLLIGSEVSKVIKSISTKTVISDNIGERSSDHKAVIMTVAATSLSRGPNYWKLNVSLLKDETYCKGIREIITKFRNNDIIDTNSLKWELFKKSVKEYSIRYGIKVAREKRQYVIKLEKDLENIENKTVKTNIDLIEKGRIQKELELYYNNIVRGNQIRARVKKELHEVESHRDVLKNIEKTRQQHNVIECLEVYDKDIYNHEIILEQIGLFYTKLFTSNNPSVENITKLLENVNLNKILNNNQKTELEKYPESNEFINAIEHIKEDRAPGLDGIGIEFYKIFWEDLKDLYTDMIDEVWLFEILPLSMRTSVISSIFKDGLKSRLTNYCPLSLNNTDYKIIACIFASRMKRVLGTLINFDQCAYLKDRFIGCNVRNIIDIFEYCESYNVPGALLCMDMMKAFDSLEHDFMWLTLEKFNFGVNFIKWIKILYYEPRFKVKNNGWLSGSYTMERGIRQGCSMSSLIFILVMEVLATMVRSNENIKGIEINNNEHKLVMYADDVTFILKDKDSVNHVIDTVNTFSDCAGPRISYKKTRGIWMGPLKDEGMRIFRNIVWTGKPIKCLGIYIGHDKSMCNELNWGKKLVNIENTLNTWKKARLTIMGKIEIIKIHAVSKIVYTASVIDIPIEMVKSLKSMFYLFYGERGIK